MHPLEPAWEEVRREFAAASEQAARAERSRVVYDLNQLVRRFRQYETEAEWVNLVLEGARGFAHQVAVFALENDVLHLRGQVNLEVPEVLSFPIAWAGAFESVCTSKDQVTALRTPAEVTEALSTDSSGERAHLFPITNGTRMAAVLFGSADQASDVNGLELVAGLAASVLERQSNARMQTKLPVLQPPTVTAEVPVSYSASANGISAPEEAVDRGAEQAFAAAAANTGSLPHVVLSPVIPKAAAYVPEPRAPRLPAWADLDEGKRQLHIRAQRFARVTVAEMQLAKPEGCRAGREQANLYLFLNKEIDKAREIYRKQFMTIASMVDYFHLELVRTAAEGDERKLGADYPGQLV